MPIGTFAVPGNGVAAVYGCEPIASNDGSDE